LMVMANCMMALLPSDELIHRGGAESPRIRTSAVTYGLGGVALARPGF
jgi:hypothetical protein